MGSEINCNVIKKKLEKLLHPTAAEEREKNVFEDPCKNILANKERFEIHFFPCMEKGVFLGRAIPVFWGYQTLRKQNEEHRNSQGSAQWKGRVLFILQFHKKKNLEKLCEMGMARAVDVSSILHISFKNIDILI